MANEIITKENGEIKLSSNVLDFMRHSNKETRCWDCANGYPNNCPKIADLEKKPIDQYEFITKGYQVIKDGELAKFAVFECKNFHKATDNVMSTSERKKLMDGIVAEFYNTDDPAMGWKMVSKNFKKKRFY